MIFIKKIIHTAIRQIGKTFRLTQHIPGHHNRDKRLPIHTTNSNAIRIVVNNLYGHSSESNHHLPPFASSLIMHVLTNAEKLIPRRDAASLAESRKLAGIRIVTGTTSPFTRYERISVSPASCSIRSEYVIAFYTFKLQYKCNNSTPAWEQRKFSNLTDRVSMQSSDPDLPQVEYEDIVSGEGTLNKDLRDKEGGKTGIKFYAGDVLYGKLRPYLMNWLYPQFNGVAVGDFWVLRATECDSSFLYRLVQTDSFQRLANVSSGSKMPRADWNLISQSFFAVPADYAEQRVIAKSLAELDDLITLHQRKRLSIRQRSPVWS